jgi:hypothetical protein
MYKVRVVRGDRDRVNVRDHNNMTKREALDYINKLGKISTIVKMTEQGHRVYVVQPSK